MTEHQRQGLPFKFAEQKPGKASDGKAGELQNIGADDTERSITARTETQGRLPPLLVGEDNERRQARSRPGCVLAFQEKGQ
jgi:hypothetical protein